MKHTDTSNVGIYETNLYEMVPLIHSMRNVLSRDLAINEQWSNGKFWEVNPRLKQSHILIDIPITKRLKTFDRKEKNSIDNQLETIEIISKKLNKILREEKYQELCGKFSDPLTRFIGRFFSSSLQLPSTEMLHLANPMKMNAFDAIPRRRLQTFLLRKVF